MVGQKVQTPSLHEKTPETKKRKSNENVADLKAPHCDPVSNLSPKKLCLRYDDDAYMQGEYFNATCIQQNKPASGNISQRALLPNPPLNSFPLIGLNSNIVPAKPKSCIRCASGDTLVQIFESNTGHLTPAHFTSFVLPCLQSIRSGFLKLGQLDGRKPVPMTIFAKGAWWALPELRDVGFEVIGLDWTHEPQQARQILGPTQTIQGNLDPCALYGDKELIESKVAEMLKGFGKRNYIANLGHGIYPDTDPEKVAFLLESIRKQSAQL